MPGEKFGSRTIILIMVGVLAIIMIPVIIAIILTPSKVDSQRELSENCLETFRSHMSEGSWTHGLEGVNGELWCLITAKDGSINIKTIEGYGQFRR